MGSEKDRINEHKHGVGFHEAAAVFGDPSAITFSDPDHSEHEDRCLTFGLSRFDRLIVVSPTARWQRVRVISARLMRCKDRRIYEQG